MSSTTNNSSANHVTLLYFYSFIILMIITGSINTIANKLQNSSVSLGEQYNHSFFITFLMFLSESFCLIIYSFEKKPIQNNANNNNQINSNEILYQADVPESSNLLEQNNQNIQNTNDGNNNDNNNNANSNTNTIQNAAEIKPEATPFMLILPALCDFFGSTIMTIGLTMLAGSTYQMMRGSVILFTAIFARIFLKSKLLIHHYIALTIVISGLTLVGAANIIIKPIFPSFCTKSAEESSSLTGYVLIILAQIFVATQFIIEETFMKKYNCHPLKAIGWEGVWGSSMYFIVLFIFQNVKCPNPTGNEKNWSTALCTKNDINEYRLEDTLFAFRQIANNTSLLFFTVLYMVSISVFNFVGITVSKIASGAARAVIDSVRTVVIWAFFMMPIVEVCHREHFNSIQLFGFMFLIFGTLIYNEIIEVPFTKKKAQNRKEEIRANEEQEDLQTAPGSSV